MTTTPVPGVSRRPRKATAKPSSKGREASCTTCTRVCREEECFWVNNGPVLASLEGLRDALSHMTDEQFTYHTKRDGNDFARWIRDSLGDAETATRIARARTRSGAVQALRVACACC